MISKASVLALLTAGFVAGVPMAMAAPADASVAAPPSVQMRAPHNTETVGYFRTKSDCEWAGRAGTMQDRWTDPNCDQASYGSYRGMWELVVMRGYLNGAGHPGHEFPGGQGHQGHQGGGHPH